MPNPHSSESAQSLALILEDDLAKLRMTLYYTAYDDNATISTLSNLKIYLISLLFFIVLYQQCLIYLPAIMM